MSTLRPRFLPDFLKNRLLLGALLAVNMTEFGFSECLAAPKKPLSSPDHLVGFERLEGNTIVFNAPAGFVPPKPLKTSLFDLSYLGVLHPEEGLPYFLFSGKPCENCLDDKTIYAIRPSGGNPNAFVYPGKILEPESRSPTLKSRAFFGKCLPGRGDVLVIFQDEKVDRRRFPQSSVMIAEARKDSMSEDLLERRLPRLQSTLQLVKRKVCREIDGRNRIMLSKPLDLHPHNDVDTGDTGDTKEENGEKDGDTNGNSDPTQKSVQDRATPDTR